MTVCLIVARICLDGYEDAQVRVSSTRENLIVDII